MHIAKVKPPPLHRFTVAGLAIAAAVVVAMGLGGTLLGTSHPADRAPGLPAAPPSATATPTTAAPLVPSSGAPPVPPGAVPWTGSATCEVTDPGESRTFHPLRAGARVEVTEVAGRTLTCSDAATDPRGSGTRTVVLNSTAKLDPGSIPPLGWPLRDEMTWDGSFTYAGRAHLRNAGGSWTMIWSGTSAPDRTEVHATVHGIGLDGYTGLVLEATLLMEPDGTSEIEGTIATSR